MRTIKTKVKNPMPPVQELAGPPKLSETIRKIKGIGKPQKSL